MNIAYQYKWCIIMALPVSPLPGKLMSRKMYNKQITIQHFVDFIIRWQLTIYVLFLTENKTTFHSKCLYRVLKVTPRKHAYSNI